MLSAFQVKKFFENLMYIELKERKLTGKLKI